jgi:hypothetical protein
MVTVTKIVNKTVSDDDEVCEAVIGFDYAKSRMEAVDVF